MATTTFDPDAYLASIGKGPAAAQTATFNPDAYVKNIQARVANPPQAQPAQAPNLFHTDIPIPLGAGGMTTINPAGALNAAKDMGFEGGGIALGQAIGAPFAEVGGVSAGGAIGGFLGSVAGQLSNFANPNEHFSLGRAVANGGLGLVPGSFLAKPAVSLGTKMAVMGGANLAATNAQSLIDTGSPASLGQDAMSVITGTGAAGLGKVMNSGSRAAAATKLMENNAPEKAILDAGRAEGLVLAPNQLRTAPKAVNTPMEAIGNAQATNASTQLQNQLVIDDIARREAGLPLSGKTTLPGGDELTSELTQSNLDMARKVPNTVYAAVGLASPKSKALLEAYKDASNEASLARQAFRTAQENGKYNIDLLNQAKTADATADAMQTSLEQELKDSGNASLIPKFSDARVQLAKIASIKNNVLKNGRLSAVGLAQDAVNGAKHTDGLATISDWVRSFPKSVSDFPREASTQTIFQNPLKLLGATGLPTAARAIMLGRPYQNAFVSPSYGSSLPDFTSQLAQFGTAAAGRQ